MWADLPCESVDRWIIETHPPYSSDPRQRVSGQRFPHDQNKERTRTIQYRDSSRTLRFRFGSWEGCRRSEFEMIHCGEIGEVLFRDSHDELRVAAARHQTTLACDACQRCQSQCFSPFQPSGLPLRIPKLADGIKPFLGPMNEIQVNVT